MYNDITKSALDIVLYPNTLDVNLYQTNPCEKYSGSFQLTELYNKL